MENKAVCRVCGKEYIVSTDPLLGSRMRHGVCSSECARLYFTNPQDYQDDGQKVHENYLKWRGICYIKIFRGKKVELKDLIGKKITNFQSDSESFDVIIEDDFMLEVWWNGEVKALKRDVKEDAGE